MRWFSSKRFGAGGAGRCAESGVRGRRSLDRRSGTGRGPRVNAGFFPRTRLGGFSPIGPALLRGSHARRGPPSESTGRRGCVLAAPARAAEGRAPDPRASLVRRPSPLRRGTAWACGPGRSVNTWNRPGRATPPWRVLRRGPASARRRSRVDSGGPGFLASTEADVLATVPAPDLDWVPPPPMGSRHRVPTLPSGRDAARAGIRPRDCGGGLSSAGAPASGRRLARGRRNLGPVSRPPGRVTMPRAGAPRGGANTRRGQENRAPLARKAARPGLRFRPPGLGGGRGRRLARGRGCVPPGLAPWAELLRRPRRQRVPQRNPSLPRPFRRPLSPTNGREGPAPRKPAPELRVRPAVLLATGVGPLPPRVRQRSRRAAAGGPVDRLFTGPTPQVRWGTCLNPSVC